MGHQAQAIGWSGLADVVAKELSARGYMTLHSRAAVTGIKPSTLNRRLKDNKPFKAPELFQIAAALDMTVAELTAAVEDGPTS